MKIFSPILVMLAALSCAFVSFISLPFYAVDFRFGKRFQNFFGQIWLFFLGIQVTIEGAENIPKESGFILAPNHSSMFDIPLLASLRAMHLRWVAKEQVKKIPFVSWALKAMGSFFVKRSGSAQDLHIMKEVEDGVKRGAQVVLFPEGTRTRNGQLLPFKKGAFRAAQNSGCPLLPMGILGTFDIAKAGQWPTYGHQVTVRIGKPFYVKPEEDIQCVMEKYREILINLLSTDPK